MDGGALKYAQLSVISLVRDKNKAPRAPEKVGSWLRQSLQVEWGKGHLGEEMNQEGQGITNLRTNLKFMSPWLDENDQQPAFYQIQK